MDQLHAVPLTGHLPPSLQKPSPSSTKSVFTDKASLLATCLNSTFWAHAKLLTRTPSNWIYVTQMGPGRVMKISRDPEKSYREYKIHARVDAAMSRMQRDLALNDFDLDLPYVPGCLEFCPDVAALAGSPPFSGLDGFPEHGSGYSMEYICPLSKHHARYLIRRYLTSSAQSRALSSASQASAFLPKVYLGDTKPLSDRWNADLGNRPAYLDHLLAERVEIAYLAASMGATLAILHWTCGIDAKGVEFVLGRDTRGHVQFWLIDFSDCRTFKRTPEAVVTQLVDAVVHNEPFWPRWINIGGLRELWGRFRDAYLEVSEFILGEVLSEGSLPRLFMGELDKIRGPGFLLA